MTVQRQRDWIGKHLTYVREKKKVWSTSKLRARWVRIMGNPPVMLRKWKPVCVTADKYILLLSHKRFCLFQLRDNDPVRNAYFLKQCFGTTAALWGSTTNEYNHLKQPHKIQWDKAIKTGGRLSRKSCYLTTQSMIKVTQWCITTTIRANV